MSAKNFFFFKGGNTQKSMRDKHSICIQSLLIYPLCLGGWPGWEGGGGGDKGLKIEIGQALLKKLISRP